MMFGCFWKIRGDPPRSLTLRSMPDHGRIETRTGEVSTDIGWLQKQHAWPNLAAIGKDGPDARDPAKTTTETSYYLLSTPLSAARFTEAARANGASRTGCIGFWT